VKGSKWLITVTALDDERVPKSRVYVSVFSFFFFFFSERSVHVSIVTVLSLSEENRERWREGKEAKRALLAVYWC
jgi:hypothetical protein